MTLARCMICILEAKHSNTYERGSAQGQDCRESQPHNDIFYFDGFVRTEIYSARFGSLGLGLSHLPFSHSDTTLCISCSRLNLQKLIVVYCV